MGLGQKAQSNPVVLKGTDNRNKCERYDLTLSFCGRSMSLKKSMRDNRCKISKQILVSEPDMLGGYAEHIASENKQCCFHYD